MFLLFCGPEKKRRAPDLPRGKSLGDNIDTLHPSYIDTDWVLKRRRIKWERWEDKGGFNMLWSHQGKTQLKPKSITDITMADDLGVEVGPEITSKVTTNQKRHATLDSPPSLKKFKVQNEASTSATNQMNGNDDMELHFSMVLSLSPPEGGEADLIQPTRFL